MSNKKEFGIWMDKEHAIIVGRENLDTGDFKVIAQVKGGSAPSNSNEKNEHQHAHSLQLKYFKEITSHMQNAEVVHVTGFGEVQEQFNHFLADTPQFKNTVTSDSTNQKMSEEKLVEFISEKFN